MSTRCCQAEDCTEDLVALGKPYFIKKKICERHMRAEQVRKAGCGDSLWRFCQQCGRLEPLKNFDGAKRNCRASLSRRKIQPELLTLCSTTSSIRPRGKPGSDQGSKQQQQPQQQRQQRKPKSYTAATEAFSVTEDDTMVGVEPGYAPWCDAATTGAWTAEAATECHWDSSFATHPGACVPADGCSNGMTLDQAYAQIQQQQQQQQQQQELHQQQLMLEQQLHSAMTTCADTVEHFAFGVSTQHQAAEGSTSVSPAALPANLGMFGRLNSVTSVGSSADEAMQAHVESIMMAELVAELSKTQQQQQSLQQSLLQQQQQQSLMQQQQMQHHAGLAALAPAAPCDAGSSNLPTLQLPAHPTLQQQQALLASNCRQQQVQQQQQQQHGYLTAHMSGGMPSGYPRLAAAPAAGLMNSAATAAALGCFAAPARSAAPIAAAINPNTRPAGVASMMAPAAKTWDPAKADRLHTLTTKMAQMQAMLLQMQQSLDIARRQ